MNFIFPVMWLLGKAFSIDEMMMGFQWKHHVDKRCITYKNEGDGFQGNALFGDGFTYQVYMRNDPAWKKYLHQGLLPLHSRVMALFDLVDEDHQQCAMDNLYNNSATFCRAAYNHENRVLCHGVTRKGGQGIPPSIVQMEVRNREAQICICGTVKATVLEGDLGCPGLTATKPVHYLSMVPEKLNWIVKQHLFTILIQVRTKYYDSLVCVTSMNIITPWVMLILQISCEEAIGSTIGCAIGSGGGQFYFGLLGLC